LFALVKKRNKGSFVLSHVGVPDERVLPFVLRRPYRVLLRLFSGNMRTPRFAGTIGTVLFFVTTGIYGTIIGNRTHEFTQIATAYFGFAISDVQISGQKQTPELEILRALDLNQNASLVNFNTDEARDTLLALPWVKSAEIVKLYPHGLSVTLTERVPFAIWQEKEDLSLIEQDGRVIVPFAHQEFATLPLITGESANEQAYLLVRAVASVPELKSRVKAQMLIAKRRWDLRLDNGVTIKLPEGDPAQALTGLALLDAESALLSKGILSVDLRVGGQMVVRLNEIAKLERDAFIATQDKTARSAEKHI
jgi:cell division protein FtsQ